MNLMAGVGNAFIGGFGLILIGVMEEIELKYCILIWVGFNVIFLGIVYKVYHNSPYHQLVDDFKVDEYDAQTIA